jgi:hypothetical protein
VQRTNSLEQAPRDPTSMPWMTTSKPMHRPFLRPGHQPLAPDKPAKVLTFPTPEPAKPEPSKPDDAQTL